MKQSNRRQRAFPQWDLARSAATCEGHRNIQVAGRCGGAALLRAGTKPPTASVFSTSPQKSITKASEAVEWRTAVDSTQACGPSRRAGGGLQLTTPRRLRLTDFIGTRTLRNAGAHDNRAVLRLGPRHPNAGESSSPSTCTYSRATYYRPQEARRRYSEKAERTELLLRSHRLSAC